MNRVASENLLGRIDTEFIEVLNNDTESKVFSHLKTLCWTLSHLHEEGIYHMDIDPFNLMLRKNGSGQMELVLIDFGVAVMTAFPDLTNLEVDLQLLGAEMRGPEAANLRRGNRRISVTRVGHISQM